MSRDEFERIRRADATDLRKMVAGRYACEIHCKGCGATRVVEAKPLLALFLAKRWPVDIIRSGTHLRCRHCKRNHPSIRAVDQAADSPAIGPTSEAEYRALTKRLRR